MNTNTNANKHREFQYSLRPGDILYYHHSDGYYSDGYYKFMGFSECGMNFKLECKDCLGDYKLLSEDNKTKLFAGCWHNFKKFEEFIKEEEFSI